MAVWQSDTYLPILKNALLHHMRKAAQQRVSRGETILAKNSMLAAGKTPMYSYRFSGCGW